MKNTKNNFTESSFPYKLNSRFGWVEYLEAMRSDEPHLHQIEPTNHCPYSCMMCPRTRMNRKQGLMDFKIFKKVIDEVSTYSEAVRQKEIELFHFGESLIHPDLPEMVQYASSENLNITLSVNAPEMKEPLIKKILNASPYRVIISLDGYNSDTYKKIRGKHADFNKAITQLEHFGEVIKSFPKIKWEIRMIELNENRKHLPDFVESWKEKGFPVTIRPFFPWNDETFTELGHFEKLPPYMPCPFPWQYIVVQWNGDVVGCCRDFDGLNILGNVKNQLLKEIWNGEKYKRLRHQLMTGMYDNNDMCKDCMKIYYQEPFSETDMSICEYYRINNHFTIDYDKGKVIFNEIDSDLNLKIECLNLNNNQCLTIFCLEKGLSVTTTSKLIFKDIEYIRKLIKPLISSGFLIPSSEQHKQSGMYTLTELWNHAVKNFSENPFLINVEDGSVFSYRDSDEIIQNLKLYFRQTIINESSRTIIIWGDFHLEQAFVFWGAIHAGLTIIPLDPDCSETVYKRIFKLKQPVFTLTDSKRYTKASELTSHIAVTDSEELSQNAFPLFSNWYESLGDELRIHEHENINPHNLPEIILFTSGTTGLPKGVIHSSMSLADSGVHIKETYNWTEQDVILSTGNIHTMSGLRNPFISTVAAGASVLALNRNTLENTEHLIQTIINYNVTVLTTVPSLLKQFIFYKNHTKDSSLLPIRQVLSTADRLSKQTTIEIEKLIKGQVYNYYGLTETGGFCIGQIPDKQSPPESIGYSTNSVCRLVTPDSYETTSKAKENEGELAVFSTQLSSGYLNLETEHVEKRISPWFNTGDMFKKSEKGFYTLKDRLRNIIKNSHGEIVSAAELEMAVLSLPEITDAAVIKTDFNGDREGFILFVKSTLSDKNTLWSCIKKSLNPKHLPACLEITKHIPRNSNGKPNISECLALMEK